MSEHAFTSRAMPRHPARSRPPRDGALDALGVAGLSVLGLVLVWSLVNLVPAIQLRDAIVLRDFTLLSGPGIDAVAGFLLHLLDPLEFVLWGIALVAIALARERPRVAAAVAGVMALAPLSAEKLKPLVARPHVQVGLIHIGPASWPSGHSTAALALVLSALMVVPACRRPLVAVLGAAFTLAVGCSLLILAWHMPSDVLGGYLVATCWAALAVAALRAAERRWPTGRPL